MIKEFFHVIFNAPLYCAIAGWISAQILKIVVATIKDKRFRFVSLTSSGGMPSSHAATVCALATCIGRVEGFSSPIFALSAIFAYIVIYDAINVRYETGEQAKILNKIMQNIDDGNPEQNNEQLKELVGHTPIQVVAGAAWGIAVGIIGSLIAINAGYCG